MRIVDADEFLVFLVEWRVGIPIDGHILEEIDGFGIAHFLRAVDEGTAVEERRRHVGSHRTALRMEEHGRCLLGALVVVGGEAQFHFSFGNAVVFGFVGVEKRRSRLVFVENLQHLVFEVPRIVHVKPCCEIVGIFSLGQHQNLTVASGLTQCVDGLFPEIGRYAIGHVAAESVDAHVGNPIFHRVDHREAQIGVVVVQIGHVEPVERTRMDNRVGFRVVGVPIGMFLRPRMVPRRVVRHPVENQGDAVLVADADEVFEVVERAKFGCNRLVVADAIGRILAFLDADGIDGHHPHHIDTERLDTVDAVGRGEKRFLGGTHARIHLIHDHVLHGRHLLKRSHGTFWFTCCWPTGSDSVAEKHNHRETE